MIRSLLLVAALAGVAHADVWQRAIDGNAIDQKTFQDEMALGDEAAAVAHSRSASLSAIKTNLDTAIIHYRAAAKANPKSGEPLFRIGGLLHLFFFDCDTGVLMSSMPPPTCSSTASVKNEKARDIVAAWDEFEGRVPLDPRINEILLQRAILRTKLFAHRADTKLLEGAAEDYKAIVERSDGLMKLQMDTVLGNLAETHMMLGQLDESIEVYLNAVRMGARGSVVYGLAVAMDRGDRDDYPGILIRDLGLDSYQSFQNNLIEGRVFFVPAGEEHYYLALIEESFGKYDEAIRHWKLYIQSGAQPQFHPRAKEHLDVLLAKKNLRWRPPLRGM